MERTPKVGEMVIFHDPKGTANSALVTAVWGPQCINLVYVSEDDARTDTYGRQIERQSSCIHRSLSQAHGNYWRFAAEEPVSYTAPLEK